MNKGKCCLNKGLLWLLLLPLLWFAGSMWYYKCHIQKTCSVKTEQVKTVKKVEKKVVKEVVEKKQEVKKEVVKTAVVKKEVAPKKCTGILKDYIRFGATNNSSQVKVLENFLNNYEGESLPIDGKYTKSDEDAVKRFQQKYNKDILANSTIWKDINNKPTGYVYKTTKAKINEIYCSKQKN